jgi:hypothetical protein
MKKYGKLLMQILCFALAIALALSALLPLFVSARESETLPCPKGGIYCARVLALAALPGGRQGPLSSKVR